ncbi:glycoside hydrolase family 68 protein [Qipengyuania sp. ASV99]|uniref:glycoside hydrolase family 68 protein n=1 Tax=Qipengyuania sp. ASV99 TaxID=3399681 RepID=UPI003A4C6F94
MTTAWTAAHVRLIDPRRFSEVPLVSSAEKGALQVGRVYWDMWPIQSPDGRVARIRGRELWMALSAPDRGDPSLRHFEAKIHLLEHRSGGWHDFGPLLPDSLDRAAVYEREWAGSALFHDGCVTLYFTAAGSRERPGGYQQRLWETTAALDESGLPSGWCAPHPSVKDYGLHYTPADAHEGEAGKIKAFRDPAYFRDPDDGGEYLIFSASLAGSVSAFNGAVGAARKGAAGDWQLLPPLIAADGVNNELERAHAVFHDGRYYVFWSTQRSTFAPELRGAPNGLYGMVADSLFGDYRPLNGTGLVIANPQSEPFQTYSWFVDASLQVCSFVDFWGLAGSVPENRHFGGVPAPLLQLEIDGDACGLVQGSDSIARIAR